MPAVTSQDGTKITYDRTGNGQPIILVDGAFGHRKFGPNGDLAKLLAAHYSVITYDRRGRGESGDTQPYAVEREIEDIHALVDAAGGSVYLYGISSGAGLALAAANHVTGVQKLAVYEAPFIVDNSRKPISPAYLGEMKALIAQDKRGAAVHKFMVEGVGMPAIAAYMMRLLPAWSDIKRVAHTVVYDTIVVDHNQRGKPLDASQWANITVPTLVIAGSKSPDWMQNGMRTLAETLPAATHFTLEGQTHLVKAQALAPVLLDFFTR